MFKKRSVANTFSWVAAGVVCLSGLAGAQSLPTDADPTCVVTASLFASWFQKGSVTLNGVVNPASSVTFSPSLSNPNCSFYQWAEQMFLWLNSPAPSFYGGGGPIFNSPTFYDVSPPNASNQRTLIPHVTGVILPFPLPLRSAQVGPDGLQVIFDTAGRMLEVAPAKTASDGNPLIRNAEGREVEVSSATVANGKAVFLDKAGRPIRGAKPILEKRLQEKALESVRPRALATAKLQIPAKSILIVQRFIIGGIPIFIDGLGNLDPVEQGQADDSILESQNGSLVYYTIAVNDVYAYYLTGAKTGGITPFPSFFPTTTADLTSIQNFALTKGKTFPDPSALAVEVKASWVNASTVSNPSDYITISATIPTYSPGTCLTSGTNTTCTASGTKTATLAMVGMHVVGSVLGHPEMIWSTFEHVGNTPLATYTYNGSSGVETVSQSTAGTWLFSATGSSGPFDAEHMQTSGANIQALPQPPHTTPPPFTIGASDTLRWKPFGAATDLNPFNLSEPTATVANTDIISINNSVRGQLASGDIRGNYIFSGATWTAGGLPPTLSSATPPANNSNQVGTSFLTNSTMETYEQGSDSTSAHGATNCFFCHNNGFPPVGTASCVSPPTPTSACNFLSPDVVDGLSHIFAQVQSLP
jgi:hypothetical protein